MTMKRMPDRRVSFYLSIFILSSSLCIRILIRQAFLEDLGDLADPQLARAEKLLLVASSRVWRCWGGVEDVSEA